MHATPPAPAPSRPRPGFVERDALRDVALFAFAVLACCVLVPATVNGDGVGYLRAAVAGAIVPGHLAYLPLLRGCARVAGAHDALSLLGPARAVSIASAGIAAALVHATARRLLSSQGEAGRRGALLGAGGFAVSFGALQAGCDVETYAPALAALCFAAFCAVRRRQAGGARFAFGCALAVALAALLHVENVAFAPAAVLLCTDRTADRRRGLRDALVVLGLAGALVALAYALCMHERGVSDLAGALRFVAGAGHGFGYPLRAFAPVIALYGLAKTLLPAPYPYEAGWARVIVQAALGLVAAAAIAWLASRPGRARTLGRGAALAWTVPYAAVGVAWFASDNERWIFLLPPAWLAAAAGCATSGRAARVGSILVGALCLANLALGLPLARDTSLRDRADEIATRLRPGDLLVSPGHGWDEYVGFYRPIVAPGSTRRGRLDRFPAIYYCGALGGCDAARDELVRRVGWTRARGGRVFVARGGDAPGSEGWKELALFGVTPENFPSLLPPGRLVPVAPGLARLDP